MTLALHDSIAFLDMDIPGRRLVLAHVRPEDEGSQWFLTVFDGYSVLTTVCLSLEDGERMCAAMSSEPLPVSEPSERERQLVAVLFRAKAKLSQMARIFNGPNFTDRYGDGEAMERIADDVVVLLSTLGLPAEGGR